MKTILAIALAVAGSLVLMGQQAECGGLGCYTGPCWGGDCGDCVCLIMPGQVTGRCVSLE